MKIIFKILPYHFFFLLFLFANSNAEERDYSFRDLNKNIFQLQDTNQSANSQPKKHSGLAWSALIRLGLGHHDDLTQAKSWNGPKLKTSNTYWAIRLEVGPGYKSAYLHLILSGKWPIPRTTTERGYSHTAELGEQGVLARVRLLPITSIINFTPILGYNWDLDEVATIYDPTGSTPDSLNLKNEDKGGFFGVEAQFILITLSKMPSYNKELRLVFSYIHQSLQNENINKYSFEFGLFAYSFEMDLKGKKVLAGVGSASLSIEHINWSSGRSDWFVGPSVTMAIIY